MKRQIIFTTLFLVAQVSFSQFMKKETLASQGSSHFVYSGNKSYFIQESIGQGSVINTFNTNNYSLRQGFLQPISASVLIDASDTSIDAVIFPNPFVNAINIYFNEPVVGPLDIKLFDLLGRRVFSQVYSPNPTLLVEIDQLAMGQYFLTVEMRTKSLTAKLIKK
ncbi:MAG: T9SS type A sorting domain-containing protein [Bacteroidota bacterium]